jgi:Domain of unknown function (DUF4340)
MKNNRIYIILFLVLAASAAALYFNNSNSTIKKELRDFAVKDTSSIDKIFMADRQGSTVLLERKSKAEWIVNNRLEARQDGINSLLTAVASMEVRSPVGKNLYNNTMKLLASNSIKVELYSDEKLLKTYYVGHSSMDNLGTFMYLEGSTVPFIMHIPGFNGYLSPRFFTSETSWRKRTIFAYDPGKIKSVSVSDLIFPDSSFIMQRQGDSAYVVTTSSGTNLEPLNREKVITYLINFKNISYESIDERLLEGVKDSLLKAGPFKKVAVALADGTTKEAVLYRRPITENSLSKEDAMGNPLPFDRDNLYAKLANDTAWFLCQYYTWDKLLKTPGYFKASGSSGK